MTELSENRVSGKSERICPLCKCSIESNRPHVQCPDCQTEYHSECWEENGGCGVYGCKQVPQTEHRNTLEIPASYWGQENKPCPVCGKEILAAAVRCRHCGVTFSSARPENAQEHQYRKSLEDQIPQTQRKIIWLFILCMIPFTAPFAAIWGGKFYFSSRKDLHVLPTLYAAMASIAIYVGIGQTVFIILMVLLFNAFRNG